MEECPICNGIKFVYVDVPREDPRFGRAMRCKCMAEADKNAQEQALLKYCQLPPGGLAMTFETFKAFPELKGPYNAALDLADEKLSWLILTSPPGLGKTHLALAIVNRWLSRLHAARYVYVPLLMTELRQGVQDDEYRAIMNRFLNVPLLVLDDLGVEKPSDWVREQLDTIIDSRLMNRQALVVTTNSRTENIGERIVSRFKRACMVESFGKTYALEGPTYMDRETR